MAMRPTLRIFSLLRKQAPLRPALAATRPANVTPRCAFHALRPTSVLLKAKKGKGTVELLDENDPELLEAEQQREAEETLLKVQQQRQQNQHEVPEDETFNNLYNALLAETQDPKDLHNIPKHSRLNNLIHHITDPEQLEKMPALIEQWRNKLLPVTEYTTQKLIQQCTLKARGDVAYTLLGDRQRYGLLPTLNDFSNTIATLCMQLEMEKAFITLAMVPLYNLSRTGDMYGTLIQGCLIQEKANKFVEEKTGNVADNALDNALSAAEDLVSDEKIEDKAEAKDSLERLAARFAEKGENEKADKVKQIVSSL